MDGWVDGWVENKYMNVSMKGLWVTKEWMEDKQENKRK
jgi:hypothetical protein